MYNIIQRLVVVFRQLILSLQLFCLKGMVEKSELFGQSNDGQSHWVFWLGNGPREVEVSNC